eukprot:Trichotokara_eunicae@DN2735_c0_g1_i1.p1
MIFVFGFVTGVILVVYLERFVFPLLVKKYSADKWLEGVVEDCRKGIWNILPETNTKGPEKKCDENARPTKQFQEESPELEVTLGQPSRSYSVLSADAPVFIPRSGAAP